MLEPGNPNYRLQDLEQRWAADPDSRLYQQLAEEYRKAGQTAKAAEVLQQGLERRPRDIGGWVALGRCRLELAETDGAREAFETVIARDPAHHVANKLLIDAHLQAGDAEAASERLETYRLLNDRDPEIDHFTYRLRQLQDEGSDGTEEGESAAEEPSAEEPVAEEPSAEEPVAEEPSAGVDSVVTGDSSTDEDSIYDDTLPMATSIEDVASTARLSHEAGEGLAGAGRVFAAAGSAFEDSASHSREPGEANTMDEKASPARDEPFALGAPPGPPTMEGLWAEARAARHAKAREPFSGLMSRPWVASPVAKDSELFPMASVPPASLAEAKLEPPELEPPELVEPLATVPEPEETAEPDVVEVEPEVSLSDPALVEPEPVAAEPEALVAEPEVATEPEPAMTEAVVTEPEALVSEPEVTIEPDAVDAEPEADASESSSDTEPYASWVAERSSIDELAPTQPLPKLTIPPELDEVAAEDTATAVETVQADAGLQPVMAEPAAEVDPEPAAESDVDEEVATVTLGNLYLKQGHLGEAARVFEQVLAHEPGNSAALDGLALARGGEPGSEETHAAPETVAVPGIAATADLEASGFDASAGEAPADEAGVDEPTGEIVTAAGVADHGLVAAGVADHGLVAPEGEVDAQALLGDTSAVAGLAGDARAQKALMLSNYLKLLKKGREQHDVH